MGSDATDKGLPGIAAVVIGRNEGARLLACLDSLKGGFSPVVYVDSGSTDGSPAAAAATGAVVVALDMREPFTAARARNAGFEAAMRRDPAPALVQFIDGDCSLRDGWIGAATAFLAARPEVAAVCGRRRERHPEASLYNWLTDREWDTPVGETRACGGDVLMRSAALRAVGGYNPDLIAGEEPELCVRLRAAGWKIWRLDAEMTWHDAALTRFAQWWTRMRRAGHAYAEGAALHGAPPERHNITRLRRALVWGVALPLVLLAGLTVTPWALLLALLWPLKVLRLTLRGYPPLHALFLTLGSFPETAGILGYACERLAGRRGGLIEYK
ncbi:glycosyltransferase [Seohaeicola nanhaiensis]|uniref:Glycosyltransferase n=1 Tax=Seohaeicola nanhaiensis TaxID=1387282 RepID=A0ABV9KM85_9RHOB